MTFNHAEFHSRRKSYKFIGWFALAIGLFFFIEIDIREPIPMNASRAVAMGTMFVLGGLTMLYFGYRLPLLEVTDIVHDTTKRVTASELVHLMRIDSETARRVLTKLLNLGIVRVKDPALSNSCEPEFEAVK